MVVEVRRVLALSVGVTAAVGMAAAAVLIFRKQEEEEEPKTSALSRLEVRVAADVSGQLIGRGGENIKRIERATNTRIHFRDELSSEKERVLVIEGCPDAAQLAEIVIRRTLAENAMKASLVSSTEMQIPTAVVGRLIGRGGENIKRLQGLSNCRIDVDRNETNNDNKRRVVLKGSEEQIAHAKALIEEVLAEEERNARKESRRKEQEQKRVQHESHLFLTCDNDEDHESRKQLSQVSASKPPSYYYEILDEGHSLVMVSSVCDPGHFYVQKSGPQSVALDKLSEAMTDFYDNESNRALHSISSNEINVNDIVATQFEADDKWYRAKVIEVNRDDYDSSKVELELDFVDYGDCVKRQLEEVCRLHSDFSKLTFQAIDCSLVELDLNTSFNEEACDEFERLTHCAQWKEVSVKLLQGPKEKTMHPQMPQQSQVVLELHLENNEVVNVAEELVRLGYAAFSNK